MFIEQQISIFRENHMIYEVSCDTEVYKQLFNQVQTVIILFHNITYFWVTYFYNITYFKRLLSKALKKNLTDPKLLNFVYQGCVILPLSYIHYPHPQLNMPEPANQGITSRNGLCPKYRPLYPHSLFPTLVHLYSSLEGVNENEFGHWVRRKGCRFCIVCACGLIFIRN